MEEIELQCLSSRKKKILDLEDLAYDLLYPSRTKESSNSVKIHRISTNLETLKDAIGKCVDDNKLLRKRVDHLEVHSNAMVDRLYYAEKRIHQLNKFVRYGEFPNLAVKKY